MSRVWLAATLVFFLGAIQGCATAESHDVLPTQVVYRFDEHRYLTLVGHGCEGALFYFDEKQNLKTEVIGQYARVFLPDITHADRDGDYVFIPYSDVSAFRVSKDGGKTFKTAKWVGSRPALSLIKKITVVNQQAFVETKDGRLFMTSKPFGEYWGMRVVDVVNELPTKRYAELPEFQNLPTKVPEVKNYKGWTEMHCNPDL